MKRLLILMIVLLLAAVPVFAAEPACPGCGEAVWTEVKAADWTAGGSISTGHYRLTEHIDLTGALEIPAGETVCVDLNGYNLTQVAPGTGKSYTLRVFVVSGSLTILDTTAKEENGEYLSGVISGGRCYAAETNNNTHGANIFCEEGSELNLYSGKISGGTIRRRYHATNRFAGGNIFSRGTVNIYGGVIENGKVYSDYVAGATTTGQRQIYVVGGNLAVSQGALNIYGGTITGGIAENLTKAPAAPGLYDALGGNIYINGATVTISGGVISGGIARCANQGVDNASVTEVVSTARGGNLCYIGRGELLITGGTITGGSTEATVEAYPEGTLTKKTFYSQGGNIYTCETANLRYKGGKNTDGTAYQGGCIYTDGIFHIDDGEFSGGKALAAGGKTDNFGGVIFGSKKTYIYGGVIENGTAERGGNIYAGAYLTVAGGRIQNGVATNRGGNIGGFSYMIIQGGTITGGKCNRLYGSNIWCADTLYVFGGEILDPKDAGSSITVMSNAECKFYNGRVTGGLYGYDSSSTGPGNLYIHGGQIDYVRTGAAGTNNIEIYGGSIGYFMNTGTTVLTLEQLDANRDGTPIVPACTHISRENGYTFFHHFDGYCDTCGHTFGKESCARCKQLHTNLPGNHSYAAGICTLCGFREDGSTCAIVGREFYTDLEGALAAGEATGKTVKLVKDLQIEDLSLYTHLDLNGHTLTVTGILSAENKDAQLLDSVGTGGVIGKLYTHPENRQVPVLEGDTWHLEQVDLEQKVQKVTTDRVELKFIIKDPAEDTRLDTAVDYKVCIRVTWREEGQEKFHIFRFDPALVAQYSAAWGDKMFTCKISGLEALSDWKIAAQVISGSVVTSAKDVTPPATTSVSRYESGNGFQTPAAMPTWEAINSLPQKYPGMSVDEARSAVVTFMDFAKTFTWVPDADKTYFISDSMGYHSLQKDRLYGSLPYVTVGTGNIYRFMDYMDEKTGVVDIKHAMESPVLFGNQCSLGVYYAISRVINSNHTGAYTAELNYKQGYIPVGPYTYTLEGRTFVEGGYDTDDVCLENGEQVMYESYINTQPGDGLVSPGHAILCTGAAEVVRDEAGNIIPERSYLTISDQTNGWSFTTDRFGQTYQHTRNNFSRWTFAYLYKIGYIPFTFAEFLGTDPFEETVVTYSHTGDTITKDQLMGSTVEANYGVSDIYAVFTDSEGNEVYKLAVRARTSLCRKLTFGTEVIVSKTNTSVQWGSLDKLSAEESYTVQIIAQLTTGERPVIWEGTYVQ